MDHWTEMIVVNQQERECFPRVLEVNFCFCSFLLTQLMSDNSPLMLLLRV